MSRFYFEGIAHIEGVEGVEGVEGGEGVEGWRARDAAAKEGYMRALVASVAVTLVLFAAIGSGSVAEAQHQHPGPTPQNVGAVTFENTCSSAVQLGISRGLALLHSFWYEEVDREFRAVAAADPRCVIAWWGVAMAHWQPLWELRGPSRPALDRGRQAIEKGQALGSGSARERAYLSALAQFYTNHRRSRRQHRQASRDPGRHRPCAGCARADAARTRSTAGSAHRFTTVLTNPTASARSTDRRDPQSARGT
jgi:hypothetical protein